MPLILLSLLLFGPGLTYAILITKAKVADCFFDKDEALFKKDEVEEEERKKKEQLAELEKFNCAWSQNSQ